MCGSGDEIITSDLQVMPGQKDARILSEQFGYTLFTHWPYVDGQAPPGEIKDLKLRYIPKEKRGFKDDQYSREHLSKRQATAAPSRAGLPTQPTRYFAERLYAPATPATTAPNSYTTMDQGSSYQQGFQQGLREGYQRGWDDSKKGLIDQDAWNSAPQIFNFSSGSIPNNFRFGGNEGPLDCNENIHETSERSHRLTRQGHVAYNNDQRATRPAPARQGPPTIKKEDLD